jgi:hypothetical protein
MPAGILSQISLAPETTWGTAVTPTKSIAVRPGDGIQTDTDVQFVDSIKAQLAQHTSSFKGAQTHEGEYEMDLVPNYIGYLLRSAFGGVSSVAKSAPNASVYDHTFTEAETKPALTIEQSVGDITRRYAGSIVHSLRFACNAGEALVCTAGIRAKSSATATKITAAYEAPTIRPFNFADMAAAGGFKIGGSNYSGLRSFDFTYENNHALLHAMGSNDPQFNHAKGSTVGGSFELYLDSTTAAKYTDYLNKTTQQLDFIFTGDTIGTSANYGLTLTIPRATMTAANDPISEDYCLLAVEFEGEGDTSTGKVMSAILTNLLTTYAS